jgi:zinc transporter ZupT
VEAARDRLGGARWRIWALVPLLLLVASVSAFVAAGGSLVSLLGENPPAPDQLDVRRVEFRPGEIRIRVTNPQREDLTIAAVTVDDAIVPFHVDGSRTLGRLASRTIAVPFDWVSGEPVAVGVTSSSGIQTTHEVAAAFETPRVSGSSVVGYGLIGLLVGVVPVALGLLWLPSLRRASTAWLSAFMALTAGLLSFLAVDALAEALELQATLPGPLGGAGIVLLGVALSYLTLTAVSHRLGGGQGGVGGRALGGIALATLVAVGIGLHNMGEGLAIGASFALGELALGSFFVVGFMVHNVTEGLGIATPAAEERSVSWARLALLVLIAGAPAIAGAWIGGFVTSDLLGALFFAAAAGAALEVVVEVARYVARTAPGGLTSGYVLGGFFAGLVVMYTTGLLIG